MASKTFRDPLYNYITIERDPDGWLLDLLDTPEVQRLRRIRQLGISSLTYPGADHNRLAHSLGVLHLMQLALDHLARRGSDEEVSSARMPLLASALVHDVGHGPFSHVFESCLGIDHEDWSLRVIQSDESVVNRILRGVDRSLPEAVAALIDRDSHDRPAWQKALLSSQLDMDRLDYLRRDSLFTGAGYGHFDWFRLLGTMELAEVDSGGRDLVWTEKAKFAIEEYIFARFYMFQNVYLHKTTRGFEKMLEAAWRRARQFHEDGANAGLLPALRDFWDTPQPSVRQYLGIEEFTVLSQIQAWTSHRDRALSDLSRRFLERERLAMVEAPSTGSDFAPDYRAWEEALRRLVASKRLYDPPELYCLRDDLEGRYNQPYFPEKESDEQSVKNAIRVMVEGEKQPVEISKLLPRLQPLTAGPAGRVRYYIPKEFQAEAKRLRAQWRE
ncbi:MAG: HD domain-containing protein [Gemmataceae bacterium]|nr:HD domain-containing protein [Gemmataceae bacterium]